MASVLFLFFHFRNNFLCRLSRMFHPFGYVGEVFIGISDYIFFI